MKNNKIINFFKNNSKLIKKIGITLVIPMTLTICGGLIIMAASWNLLAQTYSIGSTIFAQKTEKIDQISFNINNKQVYRPDLGQVFGKIEIPRLEMERAIVHGDGPTELKKGVGHYAGSTLPGEGGNVVLAGHRDTVFKKLEVIQLEDKILIETDYGIFEYKVSDIRITKPNDTTPTAPTENEQLTVYTCYPFNYVGRAPERFIVTCEYIGVHDK